MSEGVSITSSGRGSLASLRERALGAAALVPHRLRRWVLVVMIIAIALVAGFGFDARRSRRPVLFDRPVDAFLSGASGVGRQAAIVFYHFGDPKIFVSITAVVAVALVVLGDARAALNTVASVGLALVVVEQVLKPFFDRRLNHLPGPTFPSGHAAVAAALAGAVVLAAGGSRPLGRLLGAPWRGAVMALAIMVPCAVGTAMVALQFHYMSDVVVGVPLGLAIAGGTALSLDLIADRWRPAGNRSKRPPVAAEANRDGQRAGAVARSDDR